MTEDRVSAAKKAARAKHGDELALRALERARDMAAARGWVRVRLADGNAVHNLKGELEQFGPEELVPSPGQQVGSGAKPSRRDPKPSASLLKRFINDQGWTKNLQVASVVERWPEIVGESIAANCKVEKFEDGVLTLIARTTSWETHVRALAAHLDKRLAEEVGEGVVKEIVIKGPTVPSWKHGKFSVPGRGPRDTYD